MSHYFKHIINNPPFYSDTNIHIFYIIQVLYTVFLFFQKKLFTGVYLFKKTPTIPLA